MGGTHSAEHEPKLGEDFRVGFFGLDGSGKSAIVSFAAGKVGWALPLGGRASPCPSAAAARVPDGGSIARVLYGRAKSAYRDSVAG